MLLLRARRLGLLLVVFAGAAWAGDADTAHHIREATGVTRGLIVHLGCGTGRLTAALYAGEACLVHGLDRSAENIRQAREHIRSRGIYGPVAVDRHDGSRLPYADNLVNLLVAEDLGDVTMPEVMRVLAPRGTAYVRQKERWVTTVKPI